MTQASANSLVAVEGHQYATRGSSTTLKKTSRQSGVETQPIESLANDEQILEMFAAWSQESPPPALDRGLVHKAQQQNVVLNRVEHVREHCYGAQVLVDQSHPFFFEHPVDHVPGLLLIEAARQFGLAVAHTYYAADKESVFSLLGVDIEFKTYGELKSPVFIAGELTPLKLRRGTPRELKFEGHFIQGGHAIGQMCGVWNILPLATWKRLRRATGG